MVGVLEKSVPRSNQFTLYSLFFLIGIAAASALGDGFLFPLSLFISAACWLAAALYLNTVLNNSSLTVATVAMFCLLLGLFYTATFNHRTKVDWPYGSDVMIVGEIAARPQQRGGGQSAIISVVRIEGGGTVEGFQSKRLIVDLPLRPEVRYGEELVLRGQISKPQKNDDFDYGRYLKKYPIYGVIERAAIVEVRPNHGLRERAWRGLYRLSDHLEHALDVSLPEPQSSLASGILLGQKRSLSEDFKNSLAKTGLTHIVALSGFNITIIVIALSELMLLWLGRKKVFVISSAMVLLFVLMTGAAPSIIRAAIFSLLIVFGRNIGRQPHQTNLTLLAAVLMLVANPFLLFYDLGFQLSFLAFAGLIYFSPPIKELLEEERFRRVPKYISIPLADTLGAQIAVLPIIAYNFGQLSIIAPLSNILVLWIIPASMGFVVLTALFGSILKSLGILFAFLAYGPLTYIIKVVELSSVIPLASVEVGKRNLALNVVLILAPVLLLLYLKKRADNRSRLATLK